MNDSISIPSNQVDPSEDTETDQRQAADYRANALKPSRSIRGY